MKRMTAQKIFYTIIILVFPVLFANAQNPCKTCNANKWLIHKCENWSWDPHCSPCHSKCVSLQMVQKYLADGWLHGGCFCGGNSLSASSINETAPVIVQPENGLYSATFPASLTAVENASLRIYDNTGREIKLIAGNITIPRGTEKTLELKMDGVPAGVYILRLQTHATIWTKKLVVLM